MRLLLVSPFLFLCLIFSVCGEEKIFIGMNYPQSGPYADMGQEEWNGIQLAKDEINAAGGILGKQIEIVATDSQSKPDISAENARKLIEEHKVKFITGGVASSVALAVSKVCKEKGVLFMPCLTNANEVTCEQGHRYIFRPGYHSYMTAKALSSYLQKNFSGKRFFYISADYAWGRSMESSLRKATSTEDSEVHKGIATPFPGATENDFQRALSLAKVAKAEVLILTLFGNDLATALRYATLMGLKNQMTVIAPTLELTMAMKSGPKIMEGVVGTTDWEMCVPYTLNYERGKAFVEAYVARYNRYPAMPAAWAYTCLHQYADAVHRAGSDDPVKVIRALERHRFTLLKDEQIWRDFDHQCIQSVYLVRCKPMEEVLKDKFQQDFFEILDVVSKENAALPRVVWEETRKAAGLPPFYEPLPEEEGTRK